MQTTTIHEESNIERLRRHVEEQYQGVILGSGGCGEFGEILCHELHQGDDPNSAGLHFSALAQKWGVTVATLGEMIYDHCKRLEALPKVTHGPFNYGNLAHS